MPQTFEGNSIALEYWPKIIFRETVTVLGKNGSDLAKNSQSYFLTKTTRTKH